MDACPCGSNVDYTACCELLIRGELSAETAEQVMRSRYSAYAKKEIDYLLKSLHPDHRKDFDEKNTRSWAENSEWHKLEIIRTEKGAPGDTEGTVEFIASYSQQGKKIDHHEISYFRQEDGNWFFVSGEGVSQKPFVRSTPKISRNDPCPCGSGKKFKKCCGGS